MTTSATSYGICDNDPTDSIWAGARVKPTFNPSGSHYGGPELATVAFAVAGTNRAPSPADIPAMVTNRATSTPTTMSASAALRGSTVAKAGALAQTDGSAASGVSDGTSAGASKA